METRRQRLRGLHINRMIPNVLTLLALAAGLSALRFALQERWEHAVLAIVAAGILDGLDGRIARILKGASKFGAELDSLSDFVCFGVAPALILYLWALADVGRFGWSLVLLLCICCALRLARFNTDGDEPQQPAWSRNFFVGMPSPAGAGLVLFPMVLWFQVGGDFLREPWVVAIFMLAGAGLLVSRIRTYSFKKVHIAQGWLLPAMLGVGLYLALLVGSPWMTLSLTMVAYVASIPFSFHAYRQLIRSNPETSKPPAANTSSQSPLE
jgi:CDP-diacylglycerol--serine O-phosphatidyltransferase